MIKRLNQNQLLALPDAVETPRYNRLAIQPGIFHLGIGAFHRAHLAYYTNAVLNQASDDWGIIGCSLRSPAVSDQLTPQDGLYTLVQRSGTEDQLQVIGAVQAVMLAPENPAAVIDAMTKESIRIISLTITEKGYCHDPSTGNLNWQHADIGHDLEHLDQPVTALGFLVAALNQRYLRHQKGFTLLSCDNLSNNGNLLKGLVLQFARRLSTELAEWIDKNASFPNTMVDRIVPATTEGDRQEMQKYLGMRDEGLVICEPYCQWVIEDTFIHGRPAWEKVGVLLVSDVKPYETIKLRLLNGAHSLMAYAGYLSGYEYINEVIENPAFANLIAAYMNGDAGETINAPQGFDLQQYQQQLRQRFANPALKHRTWQIAMDGSQKLPQRLLESLREQLAAGRQIAIICLAVAAWIRYVSGVDEQGQPIDVRDPFAVKLRDLCATHAGNPLAMVQAVVGVESIFGKDLCQNQRFIEKTTQWLTDFYRLGVRATIETYY